ncbi:uncharacterized protein LOC144166440 [Haemaphysalis longicornis]
MARRVRITCSTAHSILRARKTPEDLVDSLLQARPFSSDATRHGTRTEPLARKHFEQTLSSHVTETGLVVHPLQPWLCGSPDGLFMYREGTCLLEIKCPSKQRDSDVVDHKVPRSFVPYIKYVNGELTLSKTHKYYTQVQLLMYVCNLELCFFFVYTSKQSVTIVVPRDDSFLCSAVRALEEFYFVWLLPALVKWRRV